MLCVESLFTYREEHLLEWLQQVRQVGWKMRLVICVKSETARKSSLSR